MRTEGKADLPMDDYLGYVFEHLIDHLVDAERNVDAQRYLQNLLWLEKKLEATNVFALNADFNLFLERWPRVEGVAVFARFIKRQAHVLQHNPALMFQQAINEPNDTLVFQAAESLLKSGKITFPWFKWLNKPQSHDAQITILTGHTKEVRSCAWSPDSKRILSASDDNTLRVWDADTGKTLQTLTGHTGFVGSCAWSPDGKRILSASNDYTLRVWDAKQVKPSKH